MKSTKESYFRHITRTVLERFCEIEDGTVSNQDFDVRLLNYRIDVQHALETLRAADVEVLMAVHRDGVADRDAVRLARIDTERPDRYVQLLEIKVGQTLDRRQLMDIETYLA